MIVLLPMLLTGHAGPKYGIPFPVLARASFGLRGANLPALIRAAVACGWFGIQTWIGGQGIFILLGQDLRRLGEGGRDRRAALDAVAVLRRSSGRSNSPSSTGGWRRCGGSRTGRRRSSSSARWCCWCGSPVKAGGLGPLLDQPSKLGWGADFWPVFFPALMGMIAFWSTLSLNIPDFTRFGAGQTRPGLGPVARPADDDDPLRAAVGASSPPAPRRCTATAIWDPVELAAKTDNVFGLLFALVTVLVATISVNIAANVVSPAYDLANLAPKLINFRTGALITGVVGVLIMPWKLTATPELYIFTWLGLVGGLLGTVAGILIADYWIAAPHRPRPRRPLPPGGRYWYAAGWNWRAVVAFAGRRGARGRRLLLRARARARSPRTG